jgi:hypothetical protein
MIRILPNQVYPVFTSEASTRQLMDVLCHDDSDHAELYSREASQVRLAVGRGSRRAASHPQAAPWRTCRQTSWRTTL